MRKGSLESKRGSALLSVLIIAILMLGVLGAYLGAVTQEVRYSHLSRARFQAVNMSEAGLEHALNAMMTKNWTGWLWNAANSSYNRTFTMPGWNGEEGTIKVCVRKINSSNPEVIAETVLKHGGGEVTKQLHVTLEKRGLFANGITARRQINFKGNSVNIDSYSSSVGPYQFNTRRDKGSVASALVTTDTTVSIQNADVFGYVATAGSNPYVGPNGSIRGYDTPNGVNVDENRISRDFYAEFPSTDVPSFSGAYTSIGSSVGYHGTSTKYRISSINLKNKDTLTIRGDVTMLVQGSIDVKGEIVVEPNSSLTLYVEGSITVGGNGVVNQTNIPSNLVIYGLGSSGTLKLHGSGAMQGVVYAPNYDVELKGGGGTGAMHGAVVGDTVTINGNYEFHYDEDLDNFGGGGRLRVANWVELEPTAYFNMDALRGNI